MESFETLDHAWGRLGEALSRSVRLHWPAPVRAAVRRVASLRVQLRHPLVAWWALHGRRVVRVVALMAGGGAFLVIAHLVLSLMNPPSGL